MLAMDSEVVLRDRLGLQHSVPAACAGALVAARRLDAAVDDEMRDMDVLRCKLAGHALHQAAQAELAHREGCGVDIALHARRSTREEDRATPLRKHRFRCSLTDEEAAIAR